MQWQYHQAADETITRLRSSVENRNVEEMLTGRMPGEPEFTDEFISFRSVASKFTIEKGMLCLIVICLIDWGYIVHDLETIIVLVLLELNFIPKGHITQ